MRARKDTNVEYRQYRDEADLPVVMHLVDNELSEPYSIFTYRYFLKQWPHLCFMAFDGDHCFGEAPPLADIIGQCPLRSSEIRPEPFFLLKFRRNNCMQAG